VSWRVTVSEHARARARERLDVDEQTIALDIAAAISNGRLSTHPPNGIHPGQRRHALWCWTADQSRVYAVVAGSTVWHVRTALQGPTTTQRRTA